LNAGIVTTDGDPVSQRLVACRQVALGAKTTTGSTRRSNMSQNHRKSSMILDSEKPAGKTAGISGLDQPAVNASENGHGVTMTDDRQATIIRG
jgi:hypothetical protein